MRDFVVVLEFDIFNYIILAESFIRPNPKPLQIADRY